jgi:uncharacterized protein YceH (UPF0502 family)
MALLCTLMLRGPQTVGELRQRSERLYPFTTLEDVEEVLGSLVERELVARRSRRPGQKDERFAQLLGGDEPGEDGSGSASSPAEPASTRIAALEQRVVRLEEDVASLREALVRRDD